VDRIVVGLTDRRGQLPLGELLQAKLSGVYVEDATSMYERLTGKIQIDDLRPSWMIFSEGFVVSRWTRMVKRGVDVALSSIGLVLASPFMLLTAIAVALDSDGAVLYSQARVGEGGRPFTVYKFRSMRADAEQGGTPQWARDGDDRVTKVGRFIRTTRLDELPQLWNVLRGDMSIVGPRPERPLFVAQFKDKIPQYMLRHKVKAGITGWAQVNGWRGNTSIEKRIEYDLYYIENWSVRLDLKIMWLTLLRGFFHKHAY